MKTLIRLVLLVGVALAALLKTQAAVDDQSPLAAQALPLLYVANASDSTGSAPGFVTAYDAGSCGSVAPILTIRGANTLILDDQTLAFDRNGNLFVQNFIGGDAKTLVFAPQASGNVAPMRFFSGTGDRDNLSIAVDSKGFVFIVRRQGPVMQVFAPGASGTSVSPLRTISFDGTPISVAVDNQDNVIVGVQSSNLGNAVEVFGPQAQQGSPKRIIRGSNTGLGGDDGTVPTVAFSPVNDRIYVGVSTRQFLGGGTSQNPNAHVSVFPSDGNGNVAPVRTISGTLTGLNATSIYGLAANPLTGEVFVMTNPSPFFSPGSVIVFARLANGNVLPLRSFTDSNTALGEAFGIAFSPPR